MTTPTPFVASIDNLGYTRNHTYLLNFWHTTKLNKELEYIKRNGLHPAVVSRADYSGNLDVTTTEGNNIQTNFYTSFRIFLENKFGSAKVTKRRDVDEWSLTWNTDKVTTLDNYPYNLCYYASTEMRDGLQPLVFSQYAREVFQSITVRLSTGDKLHAKEVNDTLERIETHANQGIDTKLCRLMGEVIDKIKPRLGIAEEAKSKKTPTKTVSKTGDIVDRFGRTDANTIRSLWESVNSVGRSQRTPAPEPIIQFEGDRERVRELVPTYELVRGMLRGLGNDRTRFSFILSYAKQNGANPVINTLEDTESNYRAFMALTNNMAA